MVAVQVGEHLGDLRAQHPQQRKLRLLEDRHVGSRRPRGRRGLQPDPPAADHHDPGVRGEGVLDPGVVVEGAQVQHGVEVGPGHGQPARGAAGRQQEAVVAEPSTVVGHHLVRVAVQRPDRGPQPQVDLVLGVPAVLVHEDLLVGRGAEQVLLRQRRSLVGAVRLGTDQRDGAVEALVTQRLRRLGPGQSGSDDDDPLHTHDCGRPSVAPGPRRSSMAETVRSRLRGAGAPTRRRVTAAPSRRRRRAAPSPRRRGRARGAGAS